MLRASSLFRGSAQLKKSERPSEGGEKKKHEILVVTSDSAIVRTLENALGEMGYEMAGIRDRSQVEEYLRRQKPIMVICDVDLPASSAYDLCRSLKGNLNTTSIPFVFIGNLPNRKFGYESGADDYIAKPLESAQVKARIEPLLRRGKTGRREDPLAEEKKPSRKTPEPEDVLGETLARQKAPEKTDEKRAKLSSMGFVKKMLMNKTHGEVMAKVEPKDLEVRDEEDTEEKKTSGETPEPEDVLGETLARLKALEKKDEERAKVEAKYLEVRDEKDTEKKKPSGETPELEDILGEILTRLKALEKKDEERAKVEAKYLEVRDEEDTEEKKTSGETSELEDVLGEILARLKAPKKADEKREKVEAKDMEVRDEEDTEEKKPSRETPEPEDLLGETRAPQKAPEKADEEREKVEPKDLEVRDEKATEPSDKVFQDSIRAVTEWINSLNQEGLVDLEEVKKVSEKLVEKTDSDDFLLLSMTSEPEGKKDLAYRSVRTAILSLRVGRRLSYSEEKLTQLGAVSFLHLVGMVKLLQNLGDYTEGERGRKLKDYSPVGAELLSSSVEKYGGQQYSWLPEAVSQIEEREDGSGFPLGLVGSQIHEYAKIIAVIKSYLDFIHPLAPAERIIQSEAIKKIIQMQKNGFFPGIVEAFVKEIFMFPVGSWVQLSSNEIGMVLSNRSSHPLRPTVELFYGPGAVPLPGKKKINLGETPFVFISKPIDEREIVKKT